MGYFGWSVIRIDNFAVLAFRLTVMEFSAQNNKIDKKKARLLNFNRFFKYSIEDELRLNMHKHAGQRFMIVGTSTFPRSFFVW
jgi:hypothetical protein